MTRTQLLGRPLWYELRTNDVRSAESFYTSVVGWTTAPFNESQTPYDMWMRGDGTPVGGVMNAGEMNVQPQWVMFIGVPRIEDGIAQIERLGGSTNAPLIDIPQVGRMQGVQDPQGAAFWVFEPAPSSPESPEAPPEPGDVSWHELYTTDADLAARFYLDLFGWRESQAMDMGPMGKYHIFARQWDIGGIMNQSKEMAHLPPFWGLYFRVPDVRDAVERVRANGGQVLNGPMEVPGGDQIVNCLDAQGVAFSLHQKKA